MRTAIQKVMSDNDLTQAVLAAEVGISQPYLSQLASGEKVPSVPVALRLLAALQRFEPDLTLEELVTAKAGEAA